MENLGAAIGGGVIGAIVPVVLGLLGFARFTGKLEERVNGLRRDIEKLEERFDTFNNTLTGLTERIAKLEAHVGITDV
jgi:hypothetical protein